MAYLAASNVTVTLNPEDVDRSPDGRIGLRTFPTVQFGNGALQYPALGIPMPAIGKFGFHFAIKRAYVEQPANGYIYHFDRANHKLRVFQGGAVAAGTVANASAGTPSGNIAVANHANVTPAGNIADHSHTENEAANYTANATTANASLTFTGTAANLTHSGTFTGDAMANHTHTLTGGGASAGPLAEVADGVALAATTLYMEMVGR